MRRDPAAKIGVYTSSPRCIGPCTSRCTSLSPFFSMCVPVFQYVCAGTYRSEL